MSEKVKARLLSAVASYLSNLQIDDVNKGNGSTCSLKFDRYNEFKGSFHFRKVKLKLANF